MKTTINPFSDWQQSLFHIIEISHPYMLGNKEELSLFIIERAEDAKAYFNKLVEDGTEPDLAREMAREERLLGDLKFSPTDYLGSFYWHTFNRELDVKERVEIYARVKQIFIELNVNGEFFEDQDNTNILEEKLIAYIKNNQL